MRRNAKVGYFVFSLDTELAWGSVEPNSSGAFLTQRADRADEYPPAAGYD